MSMRVNGTKAELEREGGWRRGYTKGFTVGADAFRALLEDGHTPAEAHNILCVHVDGALAWWTSGNWSIPARPPRVPMLDIHGDHREGGANARP